MNSSDSTQLERGRRSDGERSHGAILAEATRLATIDGIEGLSLSRLADAVGMSKSGLFAHFKSKEELQLATIEAADALFAAKVTKPASGAPTGAERLRQLVEGYLAYLEVETFPGGCFFSSALAEMDMHHGPVRDRLVRFLGEWLGEIEAAVRDAQTEGAINPSEDPAQLTFEIEAALFLANAQYVVVRTSEPIQRARYAIHRRLDSAADPARA